jgi:transcriptional regulator with XRE-family HTH domain
VQPALGRRIREQRQRAGLSQTDLAVAGVSASYVSLLEAGRRVPTDAVLARLADRLGVTPHLLLHGVDGAAASQARMDLAFGRLSLGQGDVPQALSVLQGVVRSGALAGDPARDFDARQALAEALERDGRLDDAVRELEALRTQAQAAPESFPWLPVVTALSRCYREAGDLHRAVDVAQAAVERCEELGLTGLEGHAQAVSTLALAHFDRGDLLRASVLLERLVETTADADSKSRAAAHWNAALVAAGRGRHGEAVRLGEHAAALIGEGDDDRLSARLKMTRAWILLGLRPPRPDAARALLLDALPALRQHDSAGGVASAEVELSRCETLLGRPAAAAEHAERAIALLGGEQPLENARARAALGRALAAAGDGHAARRALRAAASLLDAVGADRQAAAVWRDLADTHAAIGDDTLAAAAYRSALDSVGLTGTVRSGSGRPAPAQAATAPDGP